ncbi:ATPase SWSAP1 isoform X2 [Eublepharis macularius]|uniref:ATPase SWSAP1 isoform X2 n=1 Tax=Eublepharis macularius TaxID=481883 RepID=A0AA97KN73_EUBMA|nr:ATPase SWSAP1 isoform X2 [Eublepharis macularius]
MAASAAPLLLLGPAASGRSALLFRAALAAASSSPDRVLFLAPRPFQRLPGGGEAGAAPGALQRIQFLYPTSLQELLQLLASLHDILPSSPSLMVLDSLEEYLGSCPGPHVAAQLAALLLDTAHHFGQKRSLERAGCQLIVSMKFPGEAGDGAEQLSAIQRYFQAQCWLQLETQENRNSDGQGVAKLVRAHLSQPGTEDQEWMLIFEPREEMKISPVPCKSDSGTSSGSNKPPAAEVHHTLFWTSSGP